MRKHILARFNESIPKGLAVSKNGGVAYEELRRQEFNFSPDSTTFEREEWTISEQNITHVRLSMKPDKGNNACRATLTSLSFRA